MPITSKDSTPPPAIGKIGPYTVFVTPPATPSPKTPVPFPESPARKAASPPPTPPVATVQPRTQQPLPPVMAPPAQFPKNAAAGPPPDGSVLGFFRNAVTKAQNMHSSLDDYVAHWFGLNQSKYQWALDDYYEAKGSDQVEAKGKDLPGKVQNV